MQIVALLMALALLGGPQPEAAPTPEKGEKDCHGPLYYKLKAKDKEQREAEGARKEVQGFVDRVGPMLHEVRKTEMSETLEQQQTAHRECLRKKRRPDLFCSVLAGRTLEHCAALPTPERQEPCRQLLTTWQAVQAKDPALCRGLTGDVARLCARAAGESVSCEALGDGPVGAVCRALDKGGEPAADLAPEILSSLRWLQAITRADPQVCATMTDAAEAASCQALLAGDAGQCKGDRPLNEVVDNDFSCRDLVVLSREHQTPAGYFQTVILASAYPGKATCTLELHVLDGGREVTRDVATVTLDGPGFWREFYLPVGQGRVKYARSRCTWDPATAARSVGDP